jgi:hypothetical protein
MLGNFSTGAQLVASKEDTGDTSPFRYRGQQVDAVLEKQSQFILKITRKTSLHLLHQNQFSADLQFLFHISPVHLPPKI